jgi:hypothetical protein
MPVHRVPSDALDERIADIEKTERIVSITSDGANTLFVVTEPKPSKRKAPGETETRS